MSSSTELSLSSTVLSGECSQECLLDDGAAGENGAAGSAPAVPLHAVSIAGDPESHRLDGREGRSWAVECKTVRTGEADASGVVLDSGRLFGSAVAHGGSKPFQVITEETLDVWSANGELFRPPLGTRMSVRGIGRKAKSDARKKMLDTLKACHGNVLRVGGAGARGAVPMFRAHQRRRAGLIFARSSDGSCVAEDCLNAARELQGVDAAVAVRERMVLV